MVDNNLLQKLSQNLLEILDDNEYYDITIEVGSDPYAKIFRAHMVILYYRSPYLKRILTTNNKKIDGIFAPIKLPNILPETFQIILRYIYGGGVSLGEYDTSDIIKILAAASELSLQELISYVQSFLIENKGNWMEQNFNLIYQTSFENDSFLELQKYCTDLISKGSDKIFKSLDFSSIPEKLLISIIQNDSLQMREIQVWEYVLKWGLAQNPKLPSDLTSYSKDDFDALKNTLKQCIPFIKFYNLTSKEFLDKVLPYEKILPEELYEDLLKNFLSLANPNSKPSDKKSSTTPSTTPSTTSSSTTKEIKLKSVDSKIIKHQHAELILKWINELKITETYKLKLLFRASRDGFEEDKFHQICDNKSRTVTIIKVKESDEILGGYNPIAWKSDDQYRITKDSFIFSFKHNSRIEDHILSRVKDKDHAICNNRLNGPSFGKGDLFVWSMAWGCSCSKTSYENPIRKTADYFSVKELEVFQIIP